VLCSDPGCHAVVSSAGAVASARLALLPTAQHFAEKLPPLLPLPALPSSTVLDFTLAPSVLGRFRTLGSCNRYLHLKTERSRRLNAADNVRRDAAAKDALADASADEAVLFKGLLWEGVLNKLIAAAPLPACLLPPGVAALPTCVSFVDLAESAYLEALLPGEPGRRACACGIKETERHGRDRRERYHDNIHCTYAASLGALSVAALVSDPIGTAIYQVISPGCGAGNRTLRATLRSLFRPSSTCRQRCAMA
jgi:hypothetical protein